ILSHGWHSEKAQHSYQNQARHYTIFHMVSSCSIYKRKFIQVQQHTTQVRQPVALREGAELLALCHGRCAPKSQPMRTLDLLREVIRIFLLQALGEMPRLRDHEAVVE